MSCAARAAPIPARPASSTSVARARPVSPSCAASASSARSTAERPRDPEPQMSAISSAVVRPAAPRSASRSRGRSVERDLPDGPPATGLGGLILAHRAPPQRRHRRSRRPRARTTGARRFPPPSGPRGRGPAYRGGLTRPLNGRFRGAHRGQVERSATSARISRMRVERRVQAERRPDRPVPDEQPPERQGDRHARREADDRQPRRLPEGAPGDADDVRQREDQRGADDPPPDAERADPRRRGQAAEQHLLAEGRDDRPGEQLQGEAGVLAGRRQRAVGRHPEQRR